MSNQINALTAHARLRRALTTLREAECSAVTLFAEILRRRLYRELGFASIHIYAGKALGFSRSKTYEFIRLAKALEELPHLKAGIEAGKVPWTKARELVKVATPQNEKRWIEIAASGSRRELKEQVSRSRAIRDSRRRESGQGELLNERVASRPASGQGASPVERSAADTTPGRRPQPAECSAVEPGSPEAAPAQSSHTSMFPEAAPLPPEAAPVQSVTLRLSPLRRARFEALVEKLMKRHRCGRDEIVLMALEVLLGDSNQSTRGIKSTRAKKTSRGEKSTRVDSGAPYQVIVYQCETCKSSTIGPRRKPLSAAEQEQVDCDFRVLEPGKRNRGGIPPSRRRAVLLRDGHRCRVRGCGSTHFLEVHHLKARSEGGSNCEANLVVMCANCHGHLHERGVLPPLREP